MSTMYVVIFYAIHIQIARGKRDREIIIKIEIQKNKQLKRLMYWWIMKYMSKEKERERNTNIHCWIITGYMNREKKRDRERNA